MVVHRDGQHRAVERQSSRVVGDHQAGPGRGQVLDPADLYPEPFVIEEPKGGKYHGVVVLGIEAELVDRVLAGQSLAQEIGQPGDTGDQIRGFRLVGPSLVEFPDDGFDVLRGFRPRCCRRVPACRTSPLRTAGIGMQGNDFRFFARHA